MLLKLFFIVEFQNTLRLKGRRCNNRLAVYQNLGQSEKWPVVCQGLHSCFGFYKHRRGNAVLSRLNIEVYKFSVSEYLDSF